MYLYVLKNELSLQPNHNLDTMNPQFFQTCAYTSSTQFTRRCFSCLLPQGQRGLARTSRLSFRRTRRWEWFRRCWGRIVRSAWGPSLDGPCWCYPASAATQHPCNFWTSIHGMLCTHFGWFLSREIMLSVIVGGACWGANVLVEYDVDIIVVHVQYQFSVSF